MTLRAQWLGRVPYREALRWQRGRREAVVAGWAPEVVWMLEHPPVVTRGRRGGDVAGARAAGLDVVDVERGGLATWHGPGQLVGYPIVHLPSRGLSVPAAVGAIEDGLIQWLGDRGVAAERDAGARGVWVEGRKIAAIGLHVRHGVTMHGFALNLRLADAAFAGIVPCGLDAPVTDVASVLAASHAPAGLHARGSDGLAPWQVADSVGAAVVQAIRSASRSG